jgi:flagellar motor switch protein FliN/FliY
MPDPAEGQGAADAVLDGINVDIRICVGVAKPSISELLALESDAVLTLDKTIDDPVDLFIGDKLIARGVLEEVEDATNGEIAVRITQIGDPTAGLK